MKITILIVVLYSFLSSNIIAQTTITGVVTDSQKAPIPFATVYLSKTTFGVSADDHGAYSITVPQVGTYELISSCIGFETHSQIIHAEGYNLKINIQLPEHIVLLQEISINEKDRNRDQNYDLFLKCFIGKSMNAPFCTIKNPKDLIVYRNSQDSNLIAYSVKPLIILNSSFGYNIIYDLKYFNYNLYTEHLRFSGDYYFQDISNQRGKNSRTKRNRLIAYYGSRMHFLRALFADSLRQENFEMCNIEDSCDTKTLTYSIQTNELRLTSNQDSMTLYHFNPIYVDYTDKHPELYQLPYVYRPHENTSRIAFSDTLQVYKNGYYPDAYSLSWSGTMARDRIAELLPFDFVPKALGQLGLKPNE